MSVQLDNPMGPGFFIFFNEVRPGAATLMKPYLDSPDLGALQDETNNERYTQLIALLEADQWL